MRAVVDTNIRVSAILTPDGFPARILNAFSSRQFTLVTSAPMLAVLSEVLHRPWLAKKYSFSRENARQFTALLRRKALIVPVLGDVRVCRDPDDDIVIETALRGRADLLVTRDDDLSTYHI